jgi:hypothetical protein
MIALRTKVAEAIKRLLGVEANELACDAIIGVVVIGQFDQSDLGQIRSKEANLTLNDLGQNQVKLGQNGSNQAILTPMGGKGGSSLDLSGRSDLSDPSKPNQRNYNTLGARKGVVPEDFQRFWMAYPRRVKKAAAILTWVKLDPPIQAILTALEWQRSSPEWTKDGGQFIPHPSTWLNGRRWEDERRIATSSAVPMLTKTRINGQNVCLDHQTDPSKPAQFRDTICVVCHRFGDRS